MIKIIYKRVIELFFLFLYGKIRIFKNFKNEIKIKKLYINSSKFKDLYIITKGQVFTDCITNVAYIQNNKIIPKISYQQKNDIIAPVKFNTTLLHGTPKFKKHFKGKVFSLVQGASGSNYWHWLYDVVPKIEILHKNNFLNKISFFYLPDINNFILDVLKCYGITENQLINSKKFKHITADELFVFEHLYILKGTFNKGFEKIPKWIVTFLKLKFTSLKKRFNTSNKIFIDRSDSKFLHFQIKNNDQIKKYLETKGFKSYQLSQLSFFEQIYLFNNSNIIIGPHGAGFANLVFCKKRTKIFEILTKSDSNRNLYKNLSKYLKLNYRKIIIKDNSHFNIYVNLDIIKNLF